MIDRLIALNPPVLLALAAMVTAQLFKFFFGWALTRQLDFRRLVGTGGMPSSHAASVTALTTGVGLEVGLQSPLFGATAFFSLVIMYDATGIRRAAGRQAQILNQMLVELKDYHKLEVVRLRELLGHTPMEVFIGAAYGAFIALVLHPG